MGPFRALFLLRTGDSNSKQPGPQDQRTLAEASTASKDLPGDHISHLLATPLLWDFFKYDIVILCYLWPAGHRGILLEGFGNPISSRLFPPCLPQGLPRSVI